MRQTLNIAVGLCVSAALLGACATKPDPEPEPVVVAQPAPPVFTEPEPAPEPAPVVAPPPVVVLDPDAPIPGSIEDFAYQSGGEPRVFFAYDQYTLSPQARDTLRRQADWLKLYADYTAVIEGHADERGTREYNLALGARRADSVRAFLVGEGVSPGRLTTVSYGKERPIDPRSSEDGWARNRNGYTNLRPVGIG